jgi:glycine cleavage system aminomethyltransferase T
VTVYGGEAVYAEDAVIGRVRSAAFGFTVGRNIALAKLPADLELGTALELDVLGERVPAEIAPDVLYDPAHARARA